MRFLFLGLTLALMSASAVAAPSAQTPQCFDETGFCIDDATFQSYFANRGGARILGFPVSRTFRLEGFNVQFFQRVVLQNQGGNVARLNLLDPGILPVTHANQSEFPAPDPGLAADAPRPDDPAYAARVVEYLRSVSPDSWNGLPVGFSSLFNTTVPAEGVSPEIRTLLNLEIWGLPTSAPAFDPGNRGFVYQRFQRGIMHFRTDCGCTDGILVGDYLKTVLTGKDLPPDLANDMRASRFFGQYAPGANGWVARPSELTDTDLTAAFEPGRGQPQVPATATPLPLATPTPVPEAPTPTPIPTAALSGLVKPAQSGIRVAFLDIPLETTTAGDGAYAIAGIPLGEHFLYAMDAKGQVSDTYRVSLNAALVALNIDLQEFKPGSPGLFVGHIVNASGAPVSGATVWRVGGAGRTTSEAQGLFRLVDTFADSGNPKPPDKLTIIAVSGDRWGLQSFDFSGGPNKNRLEVKLTHQGSAPVSPKHVSDFKSTVFDANAADAFTARWPNNGSDLIAVDVVDKDGKPLPDGSFTMKSTGCMGECDTFEGSGISIKLPRNIPFRLAVRGKNGGDPAKPGWDEAQLVSFK
ncbi:MAG TPA: hypothetical protein VGL99_05440 [Chloroflexota bacterium]